MLYTFLDCATGHLNYPSDSEGVLSSTARRGNDLVVNPDVVQMWHGTLALAPSPEFLKAANSGFLILNAKL